MTPNEREVMELALEALENLIPIGERTATLQTKAITAIKEALAQPEQGYTTKRNVWTGNATHKCNVCGRDDFRSEHAAKFHKCEAVEEPKPHSQDKWLDIQLPDTTPPYVPTERQRTWEGLSVFEINDLVANTEHGLHELVERTEAKLKEKNTRNGGCL